MEAATNANMQASDAAPNVSLFSAFGDEQLGRSQSAGTRANPFACVRCRRNGSVKNTQFPGQGKAVNQPLRAAPKHLTEICARARTGDLFLFSSKHRASNITKFFTNSEWDVSTPSFLCCTFLALLPVLICCYCFAEQHVALVVRPRAGNTVYVIEWCAGLVVTELYARIRDYAELDAREICFRQLLIESRSGKVAVEAAIEDFTAALMEQEMGGNHVLPFAQVLKAARKSITGIGSSHSRTKQVRRALLSWHHGITPHVHVRCVSISM